jgi:DNA repair protein RadC
MSNRIAVRDLPQQDQPHYRADHVGFSALSNAELLQLVWAFKYLDTPTDLLSRAGSLTDLSRMTLEEMAEVQDIGPGAARAIKAALELGRRLMLEAKPDQTQVRSPADAAAILMTKYGHLEQEHFVVIMLDTRNRVIADEVIYKGTLNSCSVRVGEVFKSAIRRNAAAILIGHNHPSQDPEPSPQDVSITRMIAQAGELMDITLLDHIIVGKSRFVSLKERGLGF